MCIVADSNATNREKNSRKKRREGKNIKRFCFRSFFIVFFVCWWYSTAQVMLYQRFVLANGQNERKRDWGKTNDRHHCVVFIAKMLESNWSENNSKVFETILFPPKKIDLIKWKMWQNENDDHLYHRHCMDERPFQPLIINSLVVAVAVHGTTSRKATLLSGNDMRVMFHNCSSRKCVAQWQISRFDRLNYLFMPFALLLDHVFIPVSHFLISFWTSSNETWLEPMHERKRLNDIVIVSA